jgi:RNA polymerase sigma-70 factor (ECF subfamily)
VVKPSDAALVARSRDGDREAFRELFDRKHKRVYLIAYQVLGDVGSAEDVVQEVFLSLWQHCADYREEMPLDAWLRRIATNRAIDHWRARKAERRRFVSAGEADAAPAGGGDGGGYGGQARGGPRDHQVPPGPEALAGWRQLQAIWDELAALLPPQQRAAFVLREIEGLPTAAVAEALGCSPSTVRSHVAAARSTLQRELRARYPELVRGRAAS